MKTVSKLGEERCSGCLGTLSAIVVRDTSQKGISVARVKEKRFAARALDCFVSHRTSTHDSFQAKRRDTYQISGDSSRPKRARRGRQPCPIQRIHLLQRLACYTWPPFIGCTFLRARLPLEVECILYWTRKSESALKLYNPEKGSAVLVQQ